GLARALLFRQARLKRQGFAWIELAAGIKQRLKRQDFAAAWLVAWIGFTHDSAPTGAGAASSLRACAPGPCLADSPALRRSRGSACPRRRAGGSPRVAPRAVARVAGAAARPPRGSLPAPEALVPGPTRPLRFGPVRRPAPCAVAWPAS